MRRISPFILLLSALGLALLAACGGSGGNDATPPQPTTAILTLSTTVSGTIPDTTTINSYTVTITLPAGVTVKTVPGTFVVDPAAVTASGMALGAVVYGVYTPASASIAGTVKVYLVSANGFNAGEFCSVTFDIVPGSYPTVADFTPLTLDDATGVDETVSTVDLTGELSLAATAVIRWAAQ